MTRREWSVHVEGEAHHVELEHSYFTGKRTIKLDGQIVMHGGSWRDIFGSDDVFQIAGRTCGVHVRTNGITYHDDCSMSGRSTQTGRPVPQLTPVPKWAWMFIMACMALPIVTIGGLVPMLIGVAGATMCLAIVRNPDRPLVSQITLSIGIVALSWALGAMTLWGTQSLRANTQLIWRDVSSASGKYSVTMPGAPQEQTQTLDTAAGPIVMHISMFENRAGTFLVVYADYPADLVQRSDPQTLLDGGRDGAIANSNGTLLNERRTTLDGYPGREFAIDVPGDGTRPASVMTARYYLVGERLYQVAVVVPKNQPPSDSTPKFIDSFKLTQ